MSELTPAAVERRLLAVDTAMTQAELWLRRARDHEVEAKHTWEAAHRRAILSRDCPKVTRGGITTAERDAWVDDRCAAERRAYDIATVARESAADHHRTVRDQASIAMSLLKSVTTAYNVSGVAS